MRISTYLQVYLIIPRHNDQLGNFLINKSAIMID
jgi:hypothetical protein